MNDRPASLATPWVESPFFDVELASRRDLDAAETSILRTYSDLGYVTLEGIVERTLLDRVRAETEALFDPEIEEGPRSRYRVQDAWKESRAVADLALHPRVLEVLRLLYGRTPIPFQTLDFRYGSQQVNHSDAILFNTLPARFMCGVWVALEDVDEENGPLFYYPRSHKLPEYGPQHFVREPEETPDFFIGHRYPHFIAGLMQQHGFARETLRVAAGSILVWASNLVHGGSPIVTPSRTRWSQVTHYFFSDCILYVPLYSDALAGELHLREALDFRTQAPVRQRFQGRPFSTIPVGNGRFRVAFDDVTVDRSPPVTPERSAPERSQPAEAAPSRAGHRLWSFRRRVRPGSAGEA